MAANLGGINFDYDMVWKTKANPIMLESQERSLSGKLVRCRLITDDDPDEPHTFAFFWATQAQVWSLRDKAESGNVFSFTPSDSGVNEGTYNIVFARESPVTARPVVGEDAPHGQLATSDSVGTINLYNGEIKVIFV
jgi:hypothetical protein